MFKRMRESAAANYNIHTSSCSGRELCDASSMPTCATLAWTSGHVKVDALVFEKKFRTGILANLASVPQANILQFVFNTIDTTVDNAAACINACIRN